MRLKRFTVDFTLTFYEFEPMEWKICSFKWHKKVYQHLLNSLSNSTSCIHLRERPLVDQESRLLTVEPYCYQRQLVATERGPSLHLYSIIASK